MIRVLLISVFFSLGGIAYAERPSAPTAPSHASGNPAQHAVAPQAADLPCEAYYLEPRSKAFRMEKLKDAIKGLDDPDFSNQVAAISDVTCLLSEGERKNEALPAVDAVPLLIEALRQVGKKRGDFLSELLLVGSLRRYEKELKTDPFLSAQVLAALLDRADNSPADVSRWIAARTLAEIFRDNKKLKELLNRSAELELTAKISESKWGNALAVGFMKRQLAKDPLGYSPFKEGQIVGLEEFAAENLTEEQKKTIPVSPYLSLIFLDLR